MIPVYVANLPSRIDRRTSIMEQFRGKDEYSLHIVRAKEAQNGATGLWMTFCKIVQMQAEANVPYFVFCEDDHVFTSHYSFASLQKCIDEAIRMDADILSGGMSAIDVPIQRSADLFQVKSFTGMQFTVVFQKAYQRILNDREGEYVTDLHLSEILDRKFVMYPFVSVQREFGYSDVTSKNNEQGRVTRLFRKTGYQLDILSKVHRHYEAADFEAIRSAVTTLPDDVQIPTYAINLPERKDRKQHIEQQFAGRTEFDFHVYPACKHKIGALGLLQTICRIVAEAQSQDQDAVLICEDDHVFTSAYDRTQFVRQVLTAGMLGADLLMGGIGGFGQLMPVTDGLFWTDWFWCTQFMVVYKPAFQPILDATFKETDVADEFLSRMLSNKLVIAPFVSRQVDFGYSDVTKSNNTSGRIEEHFENASSRVDEYLKLADTTRHPFVRYNDDAVTAEAYLSGNHPKGLNIGCGTNILSGWLNVDLHPMPGALFMNAACAFPYADNTFDFVHSEHLLEHLSYEGGKNMLREALRVLKPGGTLRLAVPTLDFLVEIYNHPETDIAQKYAAWSLQHYAPEMCQDFVEDGRQIPLSLVVNNFMHFWGHQMLYDVATLERLLANVGFKNIQRYQPGESNNAFLKSLERHGNVIPKWANDLESVVVEAHKFN